MEDKESRPILKTPRRTRNTSILELHKSPTIEEDESSVENKLDSVTPARSTRMVDLRTPSRPETPSATQTPRRSCRKSIKPIKEYENIVAQKCLSAKHVISVDPTKSEDVDEEVAASTTTFEERETKWIPADIGRVSSKRSKKKRTKSKRLARQKKVVVAEDTEDGMEVEQSDKTGEDLEHNDSKDNDNKENIKDNISVVVEAEEKEECEEGKEKEKEEREEGKEEETKIDENPIALAEETEEVEIPPADGVAFEIPTEQSPLAESEDSMDGGDVILNAMPVTGDDCMLSPEKPRLQQDSNISVSTTPVAEPQNPITESDNPGANSTNKSNDSDCIMLSLNDTSSQSRQSLGRKSASFTVESKSGVNVSTDSIGVNMPPLLVCSDDEDEEIEFVDALKSPTGENFQLAMDEEEPCETNDEPEPMNGTFTSDEQAKEKEEEELIDTEMSPQEEEIPTIESVLLSPKEIRKIVLGIEEIPEEDPTKDSSKVSPLNGTFDADESPTKIPETPCRSVTSTDFSSSSITRILTPFKSDKQIVPDIIIEPEEELEITPNFIYESKENTQLKGSRKRSFSFCVNRPKKNVTFHSPSNTTININIHTEQPTKIPCKSPAKQTPINVTKRRKRSLSVTETERDLLDYIQMKKPSQDATPKKKSVHQSKIKMPNFSNIHQKQFQRMESITDHVARRAERAKVLINSTSKIRPASVQKGLPPRNLVLKDHNKDANKTHLPMPKARHRIDMSGVESKSSKADIENKLRTKSKQDVRPLDDVQLLSKTPTKVTGESSTSLFKQSNNINKLPRQKFNFNFDSTTLPAACGNTTVASVPQRMHLPNPRENFNLSTTITTTKPQPKADKLEDRRKRMMEMFKSKSSQRAATNKNEILKGVRTNRRFELQMMCRNRQN
ncbi:cell surface glycoprotein 1 [Eupeodes corollae]|uniref:cell surface glycoprotein 1 n=1 Tax=Eupeodes corollae TaxID=290404 RepID=UPI002490C27F|nr:cell surface glycoprotein 1 [Eupeodes corollae]